MYRFVEVKVSEYIYILMFRASAYICILKYKFPVSYIRPISIQITYYTNVRRLCRYYNTFYPISFATYNVKSVLLSSCVVWQNELLIHVMQFNGVILLEAFRTPADSSMDGKLWTEFLLHIVSI